MHGWKRELQNLLARSRSILCFSKMHGWQREPQNLLLLLISLAPEPNSKSKKRRKAAEMDFFLSNKHSMTVCNNLNAMDCIADYGNSNIQGLLTLKTRKGHLVSLVCRYDHDSPNLLSEDQLQMAHNATTEYDSCSDSLIVANDYFALTFHQHSANGFRLNGIQSRHLDEGGSWIPVVEIRP